jgi:TonB family protein
VAPEGELAHGAEAAAEPGGAAPGREPLLRVGIGGDSVDELPVPAGADPMVRARRSALAAYIGGVRERVRMNWRPKEVYEHADPRLHDLATRNRLTAVRVRLRGDGKLSSIDVGAGSGVGELDEEALAAFHRAEPFGRPPPEVLDPGGGLSFLFTFDLETIVGDYLREVGRLVQEQWHPSRAYRVFIGMDRTTVVSVRLAADGRLAGASVQRSAGLDFLDNAALAAVRPGLRLPRPPAALPAVAGLVPVRAIFVYRTRAPNEVHMVRESGH